jgi:ribosomal-protein-alanine N-acetyltransferase
LGAETLPICTAGWRDLSALSALEKRCFSEADAWPWLDLVFVLMGPGFVRYKIEYAGQMIAFAAGEVKAPEPIGWIATIAVDPQWRGQRLGTRLLLAIEASLNTQCIRLTTRRSNATAIAMYRKLGYQQVDVWEGYYYGGEDGIIFEKWPGLHP